MTDTIEMPLTWPEKLEKLEINGNILLTSKSDVNNVNQSLGRRKDLFSEKGFKIRTNRDTKETRVWRIK